MRSVSSFRRLGQAFEKFFSFTMRELCNLTAKRPEPISFAQKKRAEESDGNIMFWILSECDTLSEENFAKRL